MALLILEGCDGGGKTTLADQVEEAATARGHGVIRLHKGPPDPARWPLIEYLDDLAFYAPRRQTQQVVICDRWHLGEFVYGPIYREGSALSRRHLDVIDSYVDSLGALKVILDAPDEVLHDRAFGRGEDFLQARHLKRVSEAYRDLGKRRGWVVKDTSQPDRALASKLLSVAIRKEGHTCRDYEEDHSA